MSLDYHLMDKRVIEIVIHKRNFTRSKDLKVIHGIGNVYNVESHVVGAISYG